MRQAASRRFRSRHGRCFSVPSPWSRLLGEGGDGIKPRAQRNENGEPSVSPWAAGAPRPCSRSTVPRCKPVWQFGDRLRDCPRKPLESSRHGEVEAKIIREHCAAVGLPKPKVLDEPLGTSAVAKTLGIGPSAAGRRPSTRPGGVLVASVVRPLRDLAGLGTGRTGSPARQTGPTNNSDRSRSTRIASVACSCALIRDDSTGGGCSGRIRLLACSSHRASKKGWP